MKLIFAVLSLSLAGAAQAQEQAPRGWFRVPHGNECGSYLAMRANQNNQSIVHSSSIANWVSGYLSHYNHVADSAREIAAPSYATILAYMDKHCRDAPLSNVVRGTQALLLDLGGIDPADRQAPR